MTDEHLLCRLNDLSDPGSQAFTVHINGQETEIMLIRQGEEAFAYLNRCPHTGGPLDWKPGEFLDDDDQHIMCATHAALFRIDDGYCLAGPCRKQSLTAFPIIRHENRLFYKPT